ncbi:MAG TPA: hypothetical protein ENJ09_16330 [Planctomycetes bacterium]|nr:hypothetical protein [Planctomycetota bacterium]
MKRPLHPFCLTVRGLPFLVGVLGAIAVELFGLQLLAREGGPVDPQALASLVGRMSVPVLPGVLAALGFRCRGREAGTGARAAEAPAAQRA